MHREMATELANGRVSSTATLWAEEFFAVIAVISVIRRSSPKTKEEATEDRSFQPLSLLRSMKSSLAVVAALVVVGVMGSAPVAAHEGEGLHLRRQLDEQPEAAGDDDLQEHGGYRRYGGYGGYGHRGYGYGGRRGYGYGGRRGYWYGGYGGYGRRGW
jgi:hypothetical protein